MINGEKKKFIKMHTLFIQFTFYSVSCKFKFCHLQGWQKNERDQINAYFNLNPTKYK